MKHVLQFLTIPLPICFPQTRDWNEELQTTRELPRKNLPERLLRERAIFKVLLLFGLQEHCGEFLLLLHAVMCEYASKIYVQAFFFVYTRIKTLSSMLLNFFSQKCAHIITPSFLSLLSQFLTECIKCTV